MSDTAKHPGGRPTKITDKCVEKLEEAFKDGANITQACHIAQIDRKTYYARLNIDETFRNKMADAQEYPDVIAKMVIVKAIRSDDVDTAKWWAERRMRKEFSTRQEQEHTGEVKIIPIMGGTANVPSDQGISQANRPQEEN